MKKQETEVKSDRASRFGFPRRGVSLAQLGQGDELELITATQMYA